MSTKQRLSRLLGLLFVIMLVELVGWKVHRILETRDTLISASNLREIGQALVLYSNEYQGRYPLRLEQVIAGDPDLSPEFFVAAWGTATPAGGSTIAQRTAEFARGGHCSYAYLGANRLASDFAQNDVLMYEADGDNPVGGITCLFGDQHIQWMSTADAVQAIIQTVKHLSQVSCSSATKP